MVSRSLNTQVSSGSYGPPQVDLLASVQNHQVHQYGSWLADQNAMAVVAFSMPLQTLDLIYLFLPFSLILKCLQKIKADRVERAFLVAPVWRCRPWFPVMISMLYDNLVLPRSPNVLVLGSTGQSHPYLRQEERKFSLAVWSV